jgi:hypothetical protein
MLLPYGLEPKDIIGPIISVAAAAVSVVALFFAWKNTQIAKSSVELAKSNTELARSNADRSIYVDGQKFLIEVCKQLVSEPVLWCVYDDEPLRKNAIYQVNDPIQHAKLRAFAHLHLNMFEIIVNEVPKPAVSKRNASNVWYDYLDDTLTRSRMIREILDEPASKQIWSEALHEEYGHWKDKHPIMNVAAVPLPSANQ